MSVPTLLLTLVLLTLTDGVGEELAWRGYALPRLLERSGAIVASLILGVIWATWHLPLIWTTGSAIEHQPVWLLYADLGAKALIFTWVFLRTRGSVLIAALLHGSTNLFAVSPAVLEPGDLAVATGAMAAKWLLALALFALARPPRTPTPDPEPVEGPSSGPSTGSGNG
jgi:membrane protease YdiL (CAAX protease family)